MIVLLGKKCQEDGDMVDLTAVDKQTGAYFRCEALVQPPVHL